MVRTLDELKIGNLNFFNEAIPYLSKDYLEAEKSFINRFSNLHYLKAIYTGTNKITPGISDMDFVIVLNDRAEKRFDERDFSIEKFDSKLKYLCYHDPLIVNKEILRNFDKIFLNFKVEKCYGKTIKVKKLVGDERRLYKIESLNEAIIRHIPREMLELVLSKNIDIRRSLLVLNMLKYSIETFESVIGEKLSEFNGFLEGHKHLRNNWFELGKDKYSLLLSNLKDAISTSLDFIDTFSNYLVDNELIHRESKEGASIRFLGRRFFTLFLRDWDKKESLAKMISIFNNIRKVITILPSQLSYQITDYLNYDGILGRHIKTNTRPNLPMWSFSEQEISKERFLMLDSYTAFLESNNLSFVRYNLFGYYEKKGTVRKIKYGLKRIVADTIMKNFL